MLEKKTEKGILKYRMPNILEAYDLLDAADITVGASKILPTKRKIIANMGILIDVSSLEGFESYEDLLGDVETFAIPLSEIADEIIYKTFGAFKKKNL